MATVFFETEKYVTKNHFVFLITILLFAVASCKKDEEKYTVKGNIADYNTSVGVQNISVRLYGRKIEARHTMLITQAFRQQTHHQLAITK